MSIGSVVSTSRAALKREHARRAFILESAELLKLDELFKQFFSTVYYEVGFGDRIEERFEDVTCVTRLENPVNRRIVSIGVYGDSGFEKSGSLIFEDGYFGASNIQVHLRGSTSLVKELNEAIAVCLSGMRPWYALLSERSLLIQSFVLSLALAFSVWVISWDLLSLEGPILAGVTLAAFFVGYFSSPKFIEWFFPVSVFSIGQGIKRFGCVKTRRNFFWLYILYPIVRNLPGRLPRFF